MNMVWLIQRYEISNSSIVNNLGKNYKFLHDMKT